MNYDEGRLSLTSSHGIRISTLFDFIELFFINFLISRKFIALFAMAKKMGRFLLVLMIIS